MIRNVVMGRLHDHLTDDERHRVLQAVADIAALPIPERLASTWGRDLGLRDGGWSFSIVNDWVDADAYRFYDLDPEHNALRAVIALGCSDVARVQFEV